MIKNHYFMGYLIKFVFFLNRWFFAMYVLVLFLYLILFLLRVTFLLHCQIFVEIFIVWSLYLYIMSFQKRRPLTLECPQVHPQWGGMVGPVYSFHRCGFRRFRASAKTALSGSCRLLESHTTFSFFFRSFLSLSFIVVHPPWRLPQSNERFHGIGFFFHPVLFS